MYSNYAIRRKAELAHDAFGVYNQKKKSSAPGSFDESKHKRDANGRFASIAGAAQKSKKYLEKANKLNRLRRIAESRSKIGRAMTRVKQDSLRKFLPSNNTRRNNTNRNTVTMK